MKHLFSLIVLAFFALLISCNSGNKSDSDEIYEYVEETIDLNDLLTERLGDWGENGAICYGILALIDTDGIFQEGAVIKAKIMRIKSDSVKMKSLENINLREVVGCDKLGISKGETWWETEGDLFLDKESADAFLAKALIDATN